MDNVKKDTNVIVTILGSGEIGFQLWPPIKALIAHIKLSYWLFPISTHCWHTCGSFHLDILHMCDSCLTLWFNLKTGGWQFFSLCGWFNPHTIDSTTIFEKIFYLKIFGESVEIKVWKQRFICWYQYTRIKHMLTVVFTKDFFDSENYTTHKPLEVTRSGSKSDIWRELSVTSAPNSEVTEAAAPKQRQCPR